jgi:hypothetical protein
VEKVSSFAPIAKDIKIEIITKMMIIIIPFMIESSPITEPDTLLLILSNNPQYPLHAR